jgi:hypothetical protein
MNRTSCLCGNRNGNVNTITYITVVLTLEFTLFKTGSAMSINVRENRRGKSRYTGNIVYTRHKTKANKNIYDVSVLPSNILL